MTRTEEIQKFVQDNSSNTGDLLRDVWDALNVCMERLDMAKKQNAPDWVNAPYWANWMAQDSDGKWWLYEKKPVKSKESWLKTSGEWAPDHCMGKNWETSLQKRPQNKDQ